MLKLVNITFKYPGQTEPVLDDISLELKPGEVVCIMGANGSGKSTLARVIAGLLKPSAGELIYDTDNPESNTKYRVGILFQNPDNQMVAVTVAKEIAFALENRAMPPEEMKRRVEKVMQDFNISHLRNRLTSELSGGEKQLVALAGLMVMEPSIMILDEPDSFLDHSGRKCLREALQTMCQIQPELTEVRITQYPRVAREYSRLLVMHEGKIDRDDDPKLICADEQYCRNKGLIYDFNSDNSIAFEYDLSSQKKIDIAEIDVQNISCHYDQKPVFENLNFKIKVGEIIGLAGPTGSGKSTLGQVLCGLLEPTEGDVIYKDSEERKISLKDIRGRVAAVFQQPERQFFLPTCREEILFGPSNLNRFLTEPEIENLFQLVGLNPSVFSGRDPHTLSVGEKRRLAIAVILAFKPKFIVFDEPTSALDADGVSRFVSLARFLKTKGVGQVVITHDFAILKELAGRIYLFDGRRNLKAVSPDQFNTSEDFSNFLESDNL